MCIFHLPKSVIREIDMVCRRFLWGEKEGMRKLHLVSWGKVCLPKANGGLGFRERSKWNKAALGKYLWVIAFEQNSLWLKWVQNVYIKRIFGML